MAPSIAGASHGHSPVASAKAGDERPNATAIAAPEPIGSGDRTTAERTDWTAAAEWIEPGGEAPATALDDDRGTAAPEPDSDGDGLADHRELALGTAPTTWDTDGDGLADAAELREYGTDPAAWDTDGDRVPDTREVAGPTDPTAADTDGDGLDDAAELAGMTDPTAADTDGDSLDDARERAHRTDPTAVDTDGDGLADDREVRLGTLATDPDTDGDGITDAREATATGTNPLVADTDGDFLEDGTEQRLGTDPRNGLVPVTLPGVGLGIVLGVLATLLVRSKRHRLASLWAAVRRTAGAGRVVAGTLPTSLRSASGRRGDANDPGPTPDADPGETTASGAADARPGDGGTGGSDGRAGGRTGGGASEGGAENGQRRPAAADTSTDVDVVPDEHVVERILESHEGQVKQSMIVEATGWSKSKVSRLLSRMADDGWIVKVKIGRENLICLDGSEPDIVRASHRETADRGRPPA